MTDRTPLFLLATAAAALAACGDADSDTTAPIETALEAAAPASDSGATTPSLPHIDAAGIVSSTSSWVAMNNGAAGYGQPASEAELQIACVGETILVILAGDTNPAATVPGEVIIGAHSLSGSFEDTGGPMPQREMKIPADHPIWQDAPDAQSFSISIDGLDEMTVPMSNIVREELASCSS